MDASSNEAVAKDDRERSWFQKVVLAMPLLLSFCVYGAILMFILGPCLLIFSAYYARQWNTLYESFKVPVQVQGRIVSREERPRSRFYQGLASYRVGPLKYEMLQKMEVRSVEGETADDQVDFADIFPVDYLSHPGYPASAKLPQEVEKVHIGVRLGASLAGIFYTVLALLYQQPWLVALKWGIALVYMRWSYGTATTWFVGGESNTLPRYERLLRARISTESKALSVLPFWLGHFFPIQTGPWQSHKPTDGFVAMSP